MVTHCHIIFVSILLYVFLPSLLFINCLLFLVSSRFCLENICQVQWNNLILMQVCKLAAQGMLLCVELWFFHLAARQISPYCDFSFTGKINLKTWWVFKLICLMICLEKKKYQLWSYQVKTTNLLRIGDHCWDIVFYVGVYLCVFKTVPICCHSMCITDIMFFTKYFSKMWLAWNWELSLLSVTVLKNTKL